MDIAHLKVHLNILSVDKEHHKHYMLLVRESLSIDLETLYRRFRKSHFHPIRLMLVMRIKRGGYLFVSHLGLC